MQPLPEFALPAGWSFVPGVVFLLLAAALFAVLGRWYDPVPRAVRVLVVGAVVALLAPSLFLGNTVVPVGVQALHAPFAGHFDKPRGNVVQTDLMREVVPAAVQVRGAVADGEWPLLAPFTGPGTPLLADPQAMALQPTTWLSRVLPPGDALPLVMALRALLAMTFTFVLLRRLGLATVAAAFGTVSYGLSAFVVLWLGWPLANSAAYLPLVLYAVLRLSQAVAEDRTGRRDVALLGAGLFALLTGGHPETILHVLILGGAFALIRAWHLAGARRLRFLLRGVAASAVAFALAAPVLLPTVAFLDQTMRHRVVEQMVEVGPTLPDGSLRPLGERYTGWSPTESLAVLQVAPNAFGNHLFGDYWGPGNLNSMATGFAGTLALAGALACLGLGLRRRPGERLMLAAAAVVLAVILRLPIAIKVLFTLPVLNRSLTSHGRARVLVCFVLAYLAACALDRWLRGETRGWRWAAGLATAAGLAAWGYLGHPPTHAAQLVDLRHLSLAVQVGAATLAGLVVLGVAWWRRRSVSDAAEDDGAGAPLPRLRRRAGIALVALAAAELLFFHLPIWPPLPRPAFPLTPELEYLQEHQTTPDAHRVVSLGRTLLPNQQAVYGFSSPGVTGPLKPALLNDVLSPALLRAWSGDDFFTAKDSPLYDLFGVRYMLIPHGVRPPRAYALRMRHSGGRVFERPRPLPPAWLPQRASPCAVGWKACTAEVEDFAVEAKLDGAWDLPPTWQAPPGDALIEGWTYHGPSWRSAEARLATPRLVTTSLYQDGGWHLLVDGEPHPTFLANGPLVAAYLDAGEARLDWVHRPPGFLAGVFLAALGLLAAALYLLRPASPGPAAI